MVCSMLTQERFTTIILGFDKYLVLLIRWFKDIKMMGIFNFPTSSISKVRIVVYW